MMLKISSFNIIHSMKLLASHPLERSYTANLYILRTIMVAVLHQTVFLNLGKKAQCVNIYKTYYYSPKGDIMMVNSACVPSHTGILYMRTGLVHAHMGQNTCMG